MPDAAVQILRTTEDLQAFAHNEWLRLWLADARAMPFSHPAWLLPWWHHFGQQELRGVILRDPEGQAQCFLPFYIYPDAATGKRQLLPVGIGTSDYLDGLFSPRCSPDHVAQALMALLREPGWDELTALQLQPGSPLLAALERLPGAARFESDFCSRMPALALPDLPVKIRRNAMYYRNRAQRQGDLQLSVAGQDDCDAAFDVLVRLHTARWQERGESGVLADPQVLAWHREALPLLANAGLLRLQTLCLGGEPLGVLYALADLPDRPEPKEYFYLTAFATAHADLRPGTLLLAAAIDRAAAAGVRTIDMLRGEEGYKALWHTERASTFGVTLRREGLVA